MDSVWENTKRLWVNSAAFRYSILLGGVCLLVLFLTMDGGKPTT